MSIDQVRSPVRRLWGAVRPSPARGLASLLLASLSLACAIGLIATSGWLISRASERPPILALGIAVVAVRTFGIGRAVFRYGERLVAHDAALGGLGRLRARIVDRMATLLPGGLPQLRRGDALRRAVDDVDAVGEVGLRVFLPALAALVVCAATVVFVATLAPGAGIMLAIGLLIAGVAAPLVGSRTSAAASRAQARHRGALAAEVSSQLGACADIVAAGAVENSLARIAALDDRLRREESRAARIAGLSTALSVAAQGVALIGAVAFAVPAVSSGDLAGVDLAAVLFVPLVAFEAVAALPAAAVAWTRAKASAERIIDLTDQPDPVPDPSNPARPPASNTTLVVRGLSATWPGATAPSVQEVDFTLRPGQRLAIVGPSGSGKSTLAAALVRFIPFEGSATVGGVALDRMAGDSVRDLICLASQVPHIFDNTVAENVRLARPAASDEQVEVAVTAAGLGDWLDSQPLGIDTPVGEHGSAISGGQRQRITLARALLADAPMTIFDEPAEHLDHVMEAQLTADILRPRPDRSVIVITHSLLGLEDVDQVLVIIDGAVAESGPPGDLLANDTWFRQSHKRQDQARNQASRAASLA